MNDPLKIMDEVEREKHYNCAPLNIERLRQSADKIRDNARQGLICAAWQAGIQRWAADTIENQAARETQKDARIGRMEMTLKQIANPIAAFQEKADEAGSKLDGQMAVALANDPEYLKGIAKETLNETDRQSLAAVKAEALREFQRETRSLRRSGLAFCVEEYLDTAIDRIKQEETHEGSLRENREAKEES